MREGSDTHTACSIGFCEYSYDYGESKTDEGCHNLAGVADIVFFIEGDVLIEKGHQSQFPQLFGFVLWCLDNILLDLLTFDHLDIRHNYL